MLKINIAEIARYDREVKLLVSEINKLEAELSRRGSSKTTDELQLAYQEASDKRWFFWLSCVLLLFHFFLLDALKKAAEQCKVNPPSIYLYYF